MYPGTYINSDYVCYSQPCSCTLQASLMGEVVEQESPSITYLIRDKANELAYYSVYYITEISTLL